MDDERKEESPVERGEPSDLDAEAMSAAESDASFNDDDVDVSAEVQHEFTKLEEGIWHAPQGTKTRIVAVMILLLLGLSMVGLIVLAVVTAIRG